MRVFGSIAYVHVPREKWRKLDAKDEKCILVGYSDEQKGYKCYNPGTKQARVSCDVVFDESASWYLPSSPTPDNSIPILKDKASEADLPPDEEEIRALEERPISFRLSWPNERPSQKDHSIEESVSSKHSVVLFPRQVPKRRFTRKEKGKMKRPKYDTEAGASDWSESETAQSEHGFPEKRSVSSKRAIKSVE